MPGRQRTGSRRRDAPQTVSPTELLERILARCRATTEGGPPVVVFDLDGTLMDNRPRTVMILRELAEWWRVEEPVIAGNLAACEAKDLAYLLTESLDRLGVRRPELLREAELFWRERFFTDGYLAHDIEVPGASAFARDLYDAGAVLVYFTGRDLPLMGVGSFASLRDLGFPIGVPGTELVLKPDANMPDDAFKRLSGPALKRVGRVLAIFDNEPGNCNVLGALYPEAETVLLDTQHLPDAPDLDPAIHVLRDFRR